MRPFTPTAAVVRLRSRFATAALPVLLALGLPFAVMWRWPFDRTEVASVSVARRSVGGIFAVLHHTDAPLGLYYLLLHFWLAVGHGEGIVRLPSAVFGAAAVAVTVALGRRTFGGPVGIVAGAMLAMSVFAMRTAAEARPYSLMMLLSVSSTLLLIRATESRARSARMAYAVVAILAIYAHFFAALVIAGHVVALLLWRRRDRRLFAGTYLLVAGATAPFILYVVTQQSGEVGWIPTTSVSGVVQTAVTVSGGRFLAVVVGGLALIGSLHLRRQWRRAPVAGLAWEQLVVAMGLWLPVPLIVAMSLVKPLLVPRYFTESVPALVMLAAAGIFALRLPRARLVAATVVLALSVSSLWQSIQKPFPLEDIRRAAHTVAAVSEPGDAITFAPAYWRSAFDFYLNRLPAPTRGKLSDVAFQENAVRAGTLYDTEVSASALARLLENRSRIWIVGDLPGHVTKTTTPEPMLAFERSAAFSQYRLVYTFFSGDLAVRLFVRGAKASS